MTMKIQILITVILYALAIIVFFPEHYFILYPCSVMTGHFLYPSKNKKNNMDESEKYNLLNYYTKIENIKKKHHRYFQLILLVLICGGIYLLNQFPFDIYDQIFINYIIIMVSYCHRKYIF